MTTREVQTIMRNVQIWDLQQLLNDEGANCRAVNIDIDCMNILNMVLGIDIQTSNQSAENQMTSSTAATSKQKTCRCKSLRYPPLKGWWKMAGWGI
jgi:hypothetical protein